MVKPTLFSNFLWDGCEGYSCCPIRAILKMNPLTIEARTKILNMKTKPRIRRPQGPRLTHAQIEQILSETPAEVEKNAPQQKVQISIRWRVRK